MIVTRHFEKARAMPPGQFAVDWQLPRVKAGDRQLWVTLRPSQTRDFGALFGLLLLHELTFRPFREKLYRTVAELQVDLDAWLAEYDEARPHQGR
jgi:hypothetical protein